MPQVRRSYEEVRVPFARMSYTPDVPSTNLGPNEYNQGLNVEADVRGIRSISGDLEWGTIIPNDETPVFISSGYRQDDRYYYVVATTAGNWWAYRGDADWYDITPVNGVGTYVVNQNLTEAWSGTIPFYNDEQNPPMFWPETANLPVLTASSAAGITTITFPAQLVPPYTPGDYIEITNCVPAGFNGIHQVITCTTTSATFTGATAGPLTTTGRVYSPYPRLTMYSNTTPSGVANIAYISPTEQQITFDNAYLAAPYAAGDLIVISDVSIYFNGVYRVVSSTTTTVNYTASPVATYPGFGLGSVAPLYCWNYNPQWKSVYAKWLRLYNTPNVGNILVAGNLNVTYPDDTTEQFANTVQWSQNFGLNQAPLTWEPTVLNVANQLDVPVRGETLDAFPCNGNFYICSYWDTVVFSPINYTSTNTPILGVRLYNQGRGLLNSNCWGNTDKMVYGIDGRDVWQFDGQNFTGIGNQRVKNWLFDQIVPENADRTYMQVNTAKNQIEIYYNGQQPVVEYVTCRDTPNILGSNLVFAGGFTGGTPMVGTRVIITGTLDPTATGYINGYVSGNSYYVVSHGPGPTPSPYTTNVEEANEFILSDTGPYGTGVNGTAGTLTGLTFTFTTDGAVNRMISYRYDIDVWNAPQEISQASYATESPIQRQPFLPASIDWRPDPASRTVMYVRQIPGSKIVQRGQSTSFINYSFITSYFKRTNVKLTDDYSKKVLVHRILPEVINIDYRGLPVDPGTLVDPNTSVEIGSVFVSIDGASSVGAPTNENTEVEIYTNTENPWAQINQNANRVNNIRIINTNTDNIWLCSAVNWQFTTTEDDR